MPKSKEPIIVDTKVWEILLKIEALRRKEHKLIRKLWQDLQEDYTRRIHRLVFEQALKEDSAFPKVSKNEIDRWVIDNISTVIVTLIEQGDIIVQEKEQKMPLRLINEIINKIKSKFE